MKITHAKKRLQQRGIPDIVLRWLSVFGRRQYDGRGAVIRFFDRTARERLQRSIGSDVFRGMHESLNAYAVYRVDGQLITVGHRYKRIRRGR